MKRITKAELGSELDGRLVGVFEHFYPDNALDEAGLGTHYVVLAYAFAGRIDAVHENTNAYLECAK